MSDTKVNIGADDGKSEIERNANPGDMNPRRHSDRGNVHDLRARQSMFGSEDTIDLSGMNGLISEQDIEVRNVQRGILRERFAGVLARTTLRTVGTLVLLLPIAGGLVAVFGSTAQAEAYSTVVINLLEAVGRFAMTVSGPILIYYFARDRNNKMDQ